VQRKRTDLISRGELVCTNFNKLYKCLKVYLTKVYLVKKDKYEGKVEKRIMEI